MGNDTLTMIPGPTPVHPKVLEALGRPTTSHVAPGFVETFRACLTDLRAVALTEVAQPFIVAGSGTLAMEMALVNLLTPSDRLLVVSHGYFGDRWGEIATAFGVPFDRIAADWGQVVSPEQLAQQLKQDRYAAVAVTHVDTSTGSAAPLEAYAELLRDRDELVLLDGVCATAGIPERFDEWHIDMLITGAQKALGAPPGVALALASQRALERRRSLAQVPAYSADLLRWVPIMDNPALYFSTPPVNEIVALAAALRSVLDEGLEARFERHRRLAAAFRAGTSALGLSLFTASEWLADTLSVVLYPADIDDAAFRGQMAARGVVVAAALGPVAGKAFRVGHMGSIGYAEIERTLDVIEGSLASLGYGKEDGRARAAAAAFFG